MSEVIDMKTLTMGGKTYTVHDETARNAASAAQTTANNAAATALNAQTVANGKADDSHEQAADTITAGTFAGSVVANSSGQAADTSLLRNSKLVSAETDPTVNGEINWTYE